MNLMELLLKVTALIAAIAILRWIQRRLRKKYDFRGKVALVTGGGNGIGRLVCLRLAQRACKVIIWDIQRDLADAVVAEITAKHGKDAAVAYTVDLSVREKVLEVARLTQEQQGFVEIIINNAVSETV